MALHDIKFFPYVWSFISKASVDPETCSGNKRVTWDPAATDTNDKQSDPYLSAFLKQMKQKILPVHYRETKASQQICKDFNKTLCGMDYL